MLLFTITTIFASLSHTQLSTPSYLNYSIFLYMQNHIKPNKYIKNLPQYHQYECKICFELSDSPMRCTGPCKAVFCQRCITFTKNVRDQCPLRCSDTFAAQSIPNIHMQYHCPFDTDQCNLSIKSRSEFSLHYVRCKYVPKKYFQQMERKRRYLCHNGHKLYFLNKYMFLNIFEQQLYQKIYHLKCVSCGDEGTCPSICFTCTTQQQKAVYCVDCSTLPCTTFQCPIGHLLLGKNVGGFIGLKNSQICHMCGILPALVGQRVCFDTLCGLVICQICHSALPRQNELIPIKHPLYDQQHEPFECSLAELRRDQQVARQQILAEIMVQREYWSSEDEDSSEENSDSSERIRRFFRGQKIGHSSSEEQRQPDSDFQRNGVQFNRAIQNQHSKGIGHWKNMITSENISQRYENSSEVARFQRKNHQQQDQFFSIDSNTDDRQYQQFFLFKNEQNQPVQNVSIAECQSIPKEDVQ